MPTTSTSSQTEKRGSGKRELVENAAGELLARRSDDGRFAGDEGDRKG